MSLEIWGICDCSPHEGRTQQLLALRPQPSPCRGWKHRLLSCLFGSRSDVPSQLSAHYTCSGKTFERMEWNDLKVFFELESFICKMQRTVLSGINEILCKVYALQCQSHNDNLIIRFQCHLCNVCLGIISSYCSNRQIWHERKELKDLRIDWLKVEKHWPYPSGRV